MRPIDYSKSLLPLFLTSTFLAAMLLAASPAAADDVTGSQRLLCSLSTISECGIDGQCFIVQPADLNVPQFVVVDLEQKRLETTAASQQNRVTPIKNLEREDGLIFLQGVERGRAVSIVIIEETGELSAAIATEAVNVSVFGACTPTEQ